MKLLALAPGRQLHREQITAALWPDLDPEAAAANLRKAVNPETGAFLPPDALQALN